MKITQITKMKGCRTFRDFIWSTGLQVFQDYNLIYGWNGTGKTTIADIFRAVERKQTSFDGEFTIQTDTGAVNSNDLESGWVDQIPPIRVFNRTYVEENIFAASNGEITPIFFLGEESVEKQKSVEIKTAKRLKENDKYQTELAEKKKKDGELDSIKVRGAKAVKDALLSSTDNSYNNYNKSNFFQKIDTMIISGKEVSAYVQSDEQMLELKKRFDGTPKEVLAIPNFVLPDLVTLSASVIKLLERTVVTEVITTLKNNETLSGWVKQGLDIHKHDAYTDCQFCLQPLQPSRIKALEGHFNNEYSRIIEEISTTALQIDTIIGDLKNFTTHDKAAICEHLAVKYIDVQTVLQSTLLEYSVFLQKLRNHLESKKSKPFEIIHFNEVTPDDAVTKLQTYCHFIEQHNTDCSNHSANIIEARKKYEESIVAEYLEEYKKIKSEIADLELSSTTLNKLLTALSEEIRILELEIKEHHKAADQINEDLLSYLGHDELAFEPKENGYVIHRSGQPAPIKELSEGEKTAIALLYFLKTLEDKSFNSNGIVVIDDPVCSMDDGALFHAFGFIKERTKDAKQLFILTHNFLFFRQVKNWFQAIEQFEKPKKKSFYQTSCIKTQTGRSSQLNKVDDLLVDYESEYHYLFKLVCDASDKSGGKLSDYYHMPNVARRVLESFLAFRKPSYKGRTRLRNSLKDIDHDTAMKERVLRFVHAHSHEDQIGTPDHDASILSETPQIMSDLLELICKADQGHYDEMMKVIRPATDYTTA